ncbi:MAG: DUF2889 domain-containing protein [Peptococcaceae bacterium]|nr:DUF2889 domain-containing protein [Peptococcaceae bacterium]
MMLFNRVKSCSVEEIAPDKLEVKGLFIDSFHEICLRLEVNATDMVIVKAESEMIRVPQTYCREVAAVGANLEGIKIGPGATKAIQHAVGDAHGCTHVADLALDAIKAVIQANFKLQRRDMTQEERIALNYNKLVNTCHHWTKLGEELQLK